MNILLGGDPQVLRALQPVVILGDQQPILAATHDVHGFGHVLHDVEAVGDDLGGGQRNGFESGLDVGALRGFPWLQSVDGRTGSRMGKCMADGVISGAETHCIHLQRLPFPLCFPTIGLLGPAWRRGGAAGAGTSTFPGVKPTIFRDPGPLATKFPEEPM